MIFGYSSSGRIDTVPLLFSFYLEVMVTQLCVVIWLPSPLFHNLCCAFSLILQFNLWCLLMLLWYTLTLSIPSNSEWVASPGPRNIGAKRSTVRVEQEKPDKNAHILIVNTAVLPALSDTISLSFSQVYSEPSTHPMSKSSTLCLLLKSIESIYPVLQKLIFLWLADIYLKVKTTQ